MRDVSNVELNRFAMHFQPRFGFSSRMQRGLLHPLRKMSNFFCTCCGVNKQDNKLVSWMRASQSGMTMGSVYGTNIRWTVPKSHSAAPRPGDMHLKRYSGPKEIIIPIPFCLCGFAGMGGTTTLLSRCQSTSGMDEVVRGLTLIRLDPGARVNRAAEWAAPRRRSRTVPSSQCSDDDWSAVLDSNEFSEIHFFCWSWKSCE